MRESNSPTEPRRASGGAKTVQRTVFRAREMDAQVTCQKHKNMMIIRSIFCAFFFACLAHTTRLPRLRDFVKERCRGGEEASVVSARSVR